MSYLEIVPYSDSIVRPPCLTIYIILEEPFGVDVSNRAVELSAQTSLRYRLERVQRILGLLI